VIGSKNHADQTLGSPEPGKSNPVQDFETGAPLPASAPDELLFSSAYVEEEFMASVPLDIFRNDNQDSHMSAFLTEDFSWAMIELGVQEPLPPQDTIDELYLPTSLHLFRIH
jgi:hypothetical protein